jgi:hypothetical protein
VAVNVKKEKDLILEPDWLIIFCLIVGLLAMVFGVVGTLHYFRRQSWQTMAAHVPSYRTSVQNADLNKFHDKGGLFKHDAKILPEAGAMGGDVESGLGLDLDDGGEDGGGAGGAMGEYEVNLIMDKIQRHHDVMEKEFSNQHELSSKLFQSLLDEADELKQLLSMGGGGGGGQGGEGGLASAQKAMLRRLKAEAAARRLHEGSAGAAEASLLAMLASLNDLMNEGAEATSTRVVNEIKSSKPVAVSENLHSLLGDLADLKGEIEEEYVTSVEAEKRRMHNAKATWETVVKTNTVPIDEKVTTALAHIRRADVESDAEVSKLADGLKQFALKVPSFTEALTETEAVMIRNLAAEPDLGDKIAERSLSNFSSLLAQLKRTIEELFERSKGLAEGVDVKRESAGEMRKDMEDAVELAIIQADDPDGVIPASSGGMDESIKDKVAEHADQKIEDIQAQMESDQAAAQQLEQERAEDRSRELEKALENNASIGEEERAEIMGQEDEDRKAMEEAHELERLRQEEELKSRLESEAVPGSPTSVVDNDALEQKQAIEQKKLEEKQARELQEALSGLEEEQEIEGGDPQADVKKLYQREIASLKTQNALEKRRKMADLCLDQESRRNKWLSRSMSSKAEGEVPGKEEIREELEKLDMLDEEERERLAKGLEEDLESALDAARGRQASQLQSGVTDVSADMDRLRKQCDVDMTELVAELEERKASTLVNSGLVPGSESYAELETALDSNAQDELGLEMARQACLLDPEGGDAGIVDKIHALEEASLGKRLDEVNAMDLDLFRRNAEARRAGIDDPGQLAAFDKLTKRKEMGLIDKQKKAQVVKMKDLKARQAEQIEDGTPPLRVLRAMADNVREDGAQLASKQAQYATDATKIIASRGETELSFDQEGGMDQLLGAIDAKVADIFANNLPNAGRRLGLAADSGGDADKAAALKLLHERELKELKYALDKDGQRAKGSLKERLAARRAQKLAELAEGGASGEEVGAEVAKMDAEDEDELGMLEEKLQAEADGKIEEELARQEAQVEQGVDPSDELARLLKSHADGLTDLQAKLAAEKAKRKEALKARLAAQRRAKEAGLKKEGKGADEVEEELKELDSKGLIEEQKERAAIAFDNKKQVMAMVSEFRKSQKVSEDEGWDGKLAKLKELHELEIANLTGSLADKQRQQRKALEEKLKLRREKKLEQLAKFNASSSEVQSAEEALEVSANEDRAVFEVSCDQELVEAVAEEKVQQAARLGGGEADHEADYSGEVERLKKLHEERSRDLRRETELSAAERKAALKKRLEAKKRKKEAALKNKGVEGAELAEEMKKVEEACAAEEAKEVALVEAEVVAVLKAVDERREVGEEAADDSEARLNKLKNLHKSELANLKSTLDHKAAAKREQLMARLAAQKAEKMAKLAERGASEVQVGAAEKAAVNQAKMAIRHLENEIEEEQVKAVDELAGVHNEALARAGDADSFDSELARVKQTHDAGIGDLEAQMRAAKRERQENLKKR